MIERNGKLKQKLPTLASWNNGIKMDFVVVAIVLFGKKMFLLSGTDSVWFFKNFSFINTPFYQKTGYCWKKLPCIGSTTVMLICCLNQVKEWFFSFQ